MKKKKKTKNKEAIQRMEKNKLKNDIQTSEMKTDNTIG